MDDFQAVSSADWRIANSVGDARRSLLEDPPRAAELLQRLKQESGSAASDGRLRPAWQNSSEHPNFVRIICQFQLSCDLFDQFFNGRTGYRAQYYRSPDCGAAYNRSVLHILSDAIKVASTRNPLDCDTEVIERSLLGSWSKIWVVGDGAAFDTAPVALQAPRWVDYWRAKAGARGLRIPAPQGPQLDFKGTFIRLADRVEWVDPLKFCRSVDIYLSGWS